MLNVVETGWQDRCIHRVVHVRRAACCRGTISAGFLAKFREPRRKSSKLSRTRISRGFCFRAVSDGVSVVAFLAEKPPPRVLLDLLASSDHGQHCASAMRRREMWRDLHDLKNGGIIPLLNRTTLTLNEDHELRA